MARRIEPSLCLASKEKEGGERREGGKKQEKNNGVLMSSQLPQGTLKSPSMGET